MYIIYIKAILQTALSCLRLRDDFDKSDFELLQSHLSPAIECAPTAIIENESLGVAEGRLGLLYNALVPPEILGLLLLSCN